LMRRDLTLLHDAANGRKRRGVEKLAQP